MHLYEAIGQPLVTWGFISNYVHHAFEAIIELDPMISAVPDTVNHINNEELSLLLEMQEVEMV